MPVTTQYRRGLLLLILLLLLRQPRPAAAATAAATTPTPRRALLQHLPYWHPKFGDQAAARADINEQWGAHPLFAAAADTTSTFNRGSFGGGGGVGGGGGGSGGYGIGDESGRSHAEVVARHQRGGTASDAGQGEEKEEWGLGSRLASAFHSFNPRHEAARKQQGMQPLHTGHEGVHALDWFGHRAAEEQQRQGPPLHMATFKR